MRRCPSCGRRLPLLTIVDPTHLLTFLCQRCWATLRLNAAEFAKLTIAGAAVGFAIILVLLPLSGVGWSNLSMLFYFPLAGGWFAGRFFPRVDVEDPPISLNNAG